MAIHTQARGLLSVTEAAAVIGCSRSTAYELVREKAVPCILFRGAIRVPAAALDAWLAERVDEALAAVRRSDSP